jgi:hypothetical protein
MDPSQSFRAPNKVLHVCWSGGTVCNKPLDLRWGFYHTWNVKSWVLVTDFFTEFTAAAMRQRQVEIYNYRKNRFYWIWSKDRSRVGTLVAANRSLSRC